MDQITLQTPLGFVLIEGDLDGISKITITSEVEKISTAIPVHLEEAAQQIEEFFQGKRKQFDLKLNPKGTDFQKKYGINYFKFLLERLFLIKRLPIS